MIESRGLREISQLVRERLPEFSTHCLSDENQLIVPIESEGMAILLPYLSGRDFDRIIPDTMLGSVPVEEVCGREVLVVDASVSRGLRMLSVVTRLREDLKAKRVRTAAFVVHKECKPERVPEYKAAILSPTQYSWAKWALAEQHLDQITALDGDHPQYVFRIARGDADQLTAAIRRLGTSYELPGDERRSVRRLTVDAVEVNDPTDWLPRETRLESVTKVRVFIENSQGEGASRFSILPILYPAIPVDTKCEDDKCRGFAIDTGLCRVASQNESALWPSRQCFKCVALHSSLELLLEFMGRLRVELPKDFEFRLDIDEPALLRAFQLYDRKTGAAIWLEIQKKISRAIDMDANGEQGQLSFPKFNFDQERSEELLRRQVTGPARVCGAYSPEIQVGLEIASWWYREMGSGRNNVGDDSCGLSFSELCQRLKGQVSQLAISRSLDLLLDEGILRPRTCISTFSQSEQEPPSKCWTRCYRLGGEFVERRLVGLAKARDNVSNRQSGALCKDMVCSQGEK
jgi:hypothetical protein